MSMPGTHINKVNKKSPGNMDTKMKLNPEEGKKPFFEVPPRKTSKEQRHLLRDAPGYITKSNVFYGGGVTKQPNGGGNITQENEPPRVDLYTSSCMVTTLAHNTPTGVSPGLCRD